MTAKEMPGIIIQARSGSSRLPGKVLKKIQGKHLLVHFIDRIRQIDNINEIIVATTESKDDDIIVNMVKEYGQEVKIFRGSEQDVLDRFYQASLEYCLGDIVRITSDNLLVDPKVSDVVIRAYLESDCDYCCNNMPPTFPHGLDTEVFNFDALSTAWHEAKRPEEREHVTPYIREHPEKFKIIRLQHSEDLSKLRWTLDYPEDFDFIKAVYDNLYGKNKYFDMCDVIELLAKEPGISKINQDRIAR